MRFRLPLRAALALCVSSSVIACTAGDELADGEQAEGESGEAGGECVQFAAREPLIEVRVGDSDTLPTLSATCAIDEIDEQAGLELRLNCLDTMDQDHLVEVSAPSFELPSGVELGDVVELELSADASFELGSGPTILMRDPEGPVLAQIRSSYFGATWGPIEVDYASYCAATGEYGETGPGFVRASVTGTEATIDVFVGQPELIGDGSSEWEVHALDAYSACCHGATIDAALIRR